MLVLSDSVPIGQIFASSVSSEISSSHVLGIDDIPESNQIGVLNSSNG